MGGASNIAALGPSYRRGGSVNTGETVFLGKIKMVGQELSFLDILRTKVIYIEKKLHCFQVVPFENHFCVVGSALRHHFDP